MSPNLSTVSSDDVIESYREQLSEAHHHIAVLKSQLKTAINHINELTAAVPPQMRGEGE